MPPPPEALAVRVAPLLEDSLRRALDKNEGCPVLGGVLDGDALAGSDFFASFEPGRMAAPKGLGFSNGELGLVFPVWGVAGEEGIEGEFELEENLELSVDIHELRRPGEAGRLAFESFVPFAGICIGDEALALSVFEWWGRCGRGI